MSTTSAITSSSSERGSGGPINRKRDLQLVEGTGTHQDTIKRPKRERGSGADSYGEVDITKRVSSILASIYYDINYVCLVRNLNKRKQEPTNLSFYKLQHEEAALLLDKAVANEAEKVSPFYSDPTFQLIRLGIFVKNLGWKMLAICSLAEGFRRACRDEANTSTWQELIRQIRDNFQSLEVFARTRSLDWRGLLIKYTNDAVPRLHKELRPLLKMYNEHPHHFFISHDRQLRRPMYQGHAQVHIQKNIFDPEKWHLMESDPTLRVPENGTLVELFERPQIGVAVRALANFRKGDLLGQFAGEICPPDYTDDPVYLLCQSDQFNAAKITSTISPRRYGNWTRFISHSCSPNCEFFSRTVGKRNVMTVEVVRDIGAFEEVTVDYGPDYWRNGDRICQCGAPNCVSLEDEDEYGDEE